MSAPVEPQDALASARAVRIADLPPYERNSRTHSPSQVEEILRSVVEFGWTIPVLYDDQGVVAGHGRLMAAELAAERDIRLFMLPGEAQGGAGRAAGVALGAIGGVGHLVALLRPVWGVGAPGPIVLLPPRG